MTHAYYNEIDPYASAWLRNLVDAGHVAEGWVDDRSIEDVRPLDIGGSQAHFFAGIGGWQLALRLAGVPDNARVWTGSCPCQPFSTAGRGRGADDERHLWPVWYRLIAECRPPVVFGEQVASRAGREWLAAVRADMEGLGYAVGGADLCAAGVGAPHIRQRLWWVAYDHGAGREWLEARRVRLRQSGGDADGCGDDGSFGMDDAACARREPARVREQEEQERWGRVPCVGREGVCACGVGHADSNGTGRDSGTGARSEASGSGCGVVAGSVGDVSVASGAARWLGHGISARLEGHAGHVYDRAGRTQQDGPAAATGAWSDVEWVDCADGKRRPVESGTFPLADGVPGRVGRLRAYGNAIVPQVAAAFIVSALDAIAETA